MRTSAPRRRATTAARAGLVLQPAHVIDDVGAQLEGAIRHLGLVGVDRERHGDAAAEPLQHGRDTTELLVRVERHGAGTRRLAPDVEQIGPRLRHPHGVAYRHFRIDPTAVAGERVRRDVDDRHHERAPTQLEGPAGGEGERKRGAGGERQTSNFKVRTSKFELRSSPIPAPPACRCSARARGARAWRAERARRLRAPAWAHGPPAAALW